MKLTVSTYNYSRDNLFTVCSKSRKIWHTLRRRRGCRLDRRRQVRAQAVAALKVRGQLDTQRSPAHDAAPNHHGGSDGHEDQQHGDGGQHQQHDRGAASQHHDGLLCAPGPLQRAHTTPRGAPYRPAAIKLMRLHIFFMGIANVNVTCRSHLRQ